MRISTTTLESFRLWSDPDQDWLSEADLIASIKRETVPSPAMLLGTAFGEVLEQPERYAVAGLFADRPQGYQHGTHYFDADMMTEPLALFDRRGVFEAKAAKQYGPHTVVAKADQLIGADLHENKVTLLTFDFEKYAASYQWRFMADIFQPRRLIYHVFCLSQDSAGMLALRSINTFNLYPYPALHADCRDLLTRFVEYVTAKGLADVLNQRQEAA